MDDILQEFIAETRETLEALSGEIVAWEAAPEDRARLDAIFRFVHTVKGSCGFLDLPRLSRLSHAAEDVLAAVRSGQRAPDRALVDSVLAIVDRIGEVVEAIDAGVPLDDSGEDLLIAALAEGGEVVSHNTAAVPRAPTRSVRVNVDLLDRMMSGMSDMVLARNELARRLRDSAVEPSVEAALDRMSLTVAELRDTVTRTRMQKIDALFSALPRMVRDTAAELGKAVTLKVAGADVELDREMIEMMRDPLVHIIRNAIDHGIEQPAERRAAGKRQAGRLQVSAHQSGNQIVIEIADDGRGIDTDQLIAKLVRDGQGDARELRALSAKAKLDLVFRPGLTTKDEVSNVSGRGVGMDVVRANIEQIGGRIALESTPGKGLRIAIHVPLTLSIISAIVIGVGGQRFAITRQAVEEIVTVRGDAIRIDTLGDTAVATVRDRRLPLVDLAGVLGLAPPAGDEPAMLVIVGITGGSFAIAVGSVLDHEELVIKPASPAVMSTGLYAGKTLPDSGQPMLLLDATGIAGAAGLHFARDVDGGEPDEAVATDEPEEIPALLFLDLDGSRRAIPLPVVDRVEQVATEAIRFTAGRLRLAADGAIIPLAGYDRLEDRREIGVLRLKDGCSEMAYAIAEALDIVMIAAAIVPASEPGPVAGVALIDGEQVEILDPYWLFAAHVGESVSETRPPLCLLSDTPDGWMRTFLRPLLEATGYRVAFEPPRSGEAADVVLTMSDGPPPADLMAPVVQLRRERSLGGHGADSVYRYDRSGLLAALQRTANRGAA